VLQASGASDNEEAGVEEQDQRLLVWLVWRFLEMTTSFAFDDLVDDQSEAESSLDCFFNERRISNEFHELSRCASYTSTIYRSLFGPFLFVSTICECVRQVSDVSARDGEGKGHLRCYEWPPPQLSQSRWYHDTQARCLSERNAGPIRPSSTELSLRGARVSSAMPDSLATRPWRYPAVHRRRRESCPRCEGR
jgi:hypothetical protein